MRGGWCLALDLFVLRKYIYELAGKVERRVQNISENEDYSFEFGRAEERNQFAKDHWKFLECIPNLREAAKMFVSDNSQI